MRPFYYLAADNQEVADILRCNGYAIVMSNETLYDEDWQQCLGCIYLDEDQIATPPLPSYLFSYGVLGLPVLTRICARIDR
jgi:hypothetical protein